REHRRILAGHEQSRAHRNEAGFLTASLSPMSMTRRELLPLLAASMACGARAAMASEQAADFSLLAFLDRLPGESRSSFVDDAKLLVGWVPDVAAIGEPLREGRIIDHRDTFSSVPGFAAPTDIASLSARYRVLREPQETHGYYGVLLGLLDGA